MGEEYYSPEEYIFVNPEKKKEFDGNMYQVKLWSGSGYSLALFAVYAENEAGALDEVTEYCSKHENCRGLIIDSDEAHKTYEDCAKFSKRITDIPSWATYYAQYHEADDLTAEDKKMVDDFMEKNNLGDLVEIIEKTHNGFNSSPAFGLPCDTYSAVFSIRDKEKMSDREREENIADCEKELLDEGYFVSTDTDYYVRGENLGIAAISDKKLVRQIEVCAGKGKEK